jgi:hypothetical protein
MSSARLGARLTGIKHLNEMKIEPCLYVLKMFIILMSGRSLEPHESDSYRFKDEGKLLVLDE